MFEGHDPYLVALSVAIAILGGYTGFGLAARIRGTPDASHRLLLAGAAFFLAIGIWTMHFVGMLAAPLPAGAVYLVLPTIVSFLICALVVGVSLFFVSVGEPSMLRVVSSAVLLGVGIASMHYVGMHGLWGNFAMTHDATMVVLSVLIAIATAYGGLRAFLARQGGVQLALSAIVYGFAVSGMHYTAMAGMHLVPPAQGSHHHVEGLTASPQILSLVVALLCFVIAAGFLLSLVPDPRKRVAAMTDTAAAISGEAVPEAAAVVAIIPQADSNAGTTSPRLRPTPLGGIGQPPRAAPAPRLPVEGADVPVVDFGGRGPARPWFVRPGAPQPHRGDGPRHLRPQGGRRRDHRTRRPNAASGAGQPCQNRRGEGPSRAGAAPRIAVIDPVGRRS